MKPGGRAALRAWIETDHPSGKHAIALVEPRDDPPRRGKRPVARLERRIRSGGLTFRTGLRDEPPAMTTRRPHRAASGPTPRGCGAFPGHKKTPGGRPPGVVDVSRRVRDRKSVV